MKIHHVKVIWHMIFYMYTSHRHSMLKIWPEINEHKISQIEFPEMSNFSKLTIFLLRFLDNTIHEAR